MVSSLTPVLANIILTEFEKVVLTPRMESGILKLHYRYLDDTQYYLGKVRFANI